MKIKNIVLSVLVAVFSFVPGTIPIHADEAKGTVTVKLNEPVEGRSFALYQVEDKNGQYTEPFKKMPSLTTKNVDTARTVEQYIDSSGQNFQPYTKTYSNTDVFIGLNQGLYLVRQTEAPQGYEKMESFLVDIPYTVDSTHLTYSVECNPKVDQIKPAETPKPTAKPAKKPNENAKSGLDASTSLLYGTGAFLLGSAILAALFAKKEEGDSDENT